MIDVVIPVFNEEASLPGFAERLFNLSLELRPIFVDNNSTDNSCRIIRGLPSAVLIEHERNMGYGASLRDGIRFGDADKIIVIDADGEYPPEAIPEMVTALDEHQVVYGSRFMNAAPADISWYRGAGNRLATSLFNLLFRQEITDLYTGFKGFQRRCVASLPMECDGFEHVLEVAARLTRNSIPIHEIPIKYRLRQTGRSKMAHVPEAVKLLCLLLYFALTVRGEDQGT